MKYLIEVSTDLYIRFVAECADEREAHLRGIVDFREGVLGSFSDSDIRVDVEQVEDDTPEGDA